MRDAHFLCSKCHIHYLLVSDIVLFVSDLLYSLLSVTPDQSDLIFMLPKHIRTLTEVETEGRLTN